MAPTIYTSLGAKKGDKVFIDNFTYSDTIWPERIRNDLQFRLVDDDLQEAVASAALELDLASELGIDLNRTFAQLAITTMASCMSPSVWFYPISHVALDREQFNILDEATKDQPEFNPVQLAEDIPGISELPVTVFYSGSDVQRALAAFERTRASQASIFVDEAPRGGSDPE